MSEEKLPDLVGPGLSVVFVGTAAGRHSAKLGLYYAKPGNRFWRALHEAGITPREFEPREFHELRALGIGLTDMSKIGAGTDAQIAAHQYDIPGFEAKMRHCQPRAIAFTSKRAAAVWLGLRSTAGIAYGRQRERPTDFPEVFVLPSPSGAAARYWDLKPWCELADYHRAPR